MLMGDRPMSQLGVIGYVLLAAGAGVSFVLQQAVNADLRAALGSAAWAGFVSYLGGTICMLILAFALRDALPSGGMMARSNWWAGAAASSVRSISQSLYCWCRASGQQRS